jgi:hypothetical protein
MHGVPQLLVSTQSVPNVSGAEALSEYDCQKYSRLSSTRIEDVSFKRSDMDDRVQ